jgi:hypothetical protein
MQATGISTTQLRVRITRHWRRPLYHLASAVNVHPATLSGMLRDRLPMPAAVKRRILVILAEQRHGR